MNSLTLSQAERLVRAARTLKSEAIIRVLLSTGMRTGEICTLDVEDVDFENYRLRVLDSKKHRYFDVPVDGQTLKVLRRYLGNRKTGILFPSQKGKGKKRLTIEGVRWVVVRAAERAGLPGIGHVTPRTLRHTFANMWDDMHGSIRGLQSILRHKNLSSTQQYLDADNRAVHREYQVLFAEGRACPLVPVTEARELSYRI